MMKSIFRSLAVASLLFGAAAYAETAPAGPIGTWRMANNKITVKVNYCGGQNLCAKIVAMAKPLNKQGKPKTDTDNPNPALRGRPIVGLEIISNMAPRGQNQWAGSIYNADDGYTYRSTVKLNGNSLVVKGKWGPFSKKMNFVRVN
jgi:uncharacterized protein (DUF2147 family)